MRTPIPAFVICSIFALMITACDVSPSNDASSTGSASTASSSSATTPTLSLAWSEYPSWSVFGVADDLGLLDKAKGKQGSIEKKYGVDIVLKQVDYDTCLTLYGNSTVDAVCITNMDALAPSLRRNSVVVLPTSTSVGSDACIVVGIDSLADLKGKTTYGLEKSVSQYAFERCIVKAGEDPKAFPFRNMDPAAAAQSFQTRQPNINSIMVWNPFVMQSLATRDDAKVLFDSAEIPEEIIDSVVVGADALAKPGADKAVAAIVEAFYTVCLRLDDAATRDKTLVSLGERFSNLNAEQMAKVCEQTRFYSTPEAARTLFLDATFRNTTMPAVVDFCVTHAITDQKPVVGFDETAQLNFSTKYLISDLK